MLQPSDSMENKDLVWDLETFRKRQRAKELILAVENQLCVFSNSVEQLYTAYDIFFPKEESRKLVILPNPYAPHDTFHGIPASAVKSTGIFLVGGHNEASPAADLQMMIPISREKRKFRRVPLGVGLKLINGKRTAETPFLPVLMKGDLREFNQNTPCVHLHSLHLEQVKMLSELELRSIKDVVTERLTLLAKPA